MCEKRMSCKTLEVPLPNNRDEANADPSTTAAICRSKLAFAPGSASRASRHVLHVSQCRSHSPRQRSDGTHMSSTCWHCLKFVRQI